MPEADNSYNASVDLFERNLTLGRGGTPYLLTSARSISYDEVSSLANGIAAGLLGLGLTQGDRVLLVLQDCVEFVVTFWGAMKVGLVPVPVSPIISAKDLQFIVEDSGAKAMLFDASSERIVAASAAAGVTTIAVGTSAPTSVRDAHLWSELSGDKERVQTARTTANDAAFWLYTSGTTGAPKAVIHAHGNLRAAPHALSEQVLGMKPGDVVLSVSRMFFAYGLGNAVYLPAAAGASVVVSNAPVLPQLVQELISKHSPTLFFAVPSFYATFTNMPEARLPSVRMAISAGEALSVDLFNAFKAKFNVPLLDGLGCTETMHHFTSSRPDDAVAGSAGRALDGYLVEVRDRDGKRLPDGASGELWVRGPTTMGGYWNRPDVTKRVLVDGWLRTGDVVRLRDGRVFHEGRIDDLMKLGGIWVAPKEIEDVLRSHTAIEDAAVVLSNNVNGIPILKAFLRSQRRDRGLFDELTQLCSARLASFKVPRQFDVVEQLPRTTTGKLKRFELRRSTPGAAKPGVIVVLFSEGVRADGPEVKVLLQQLSRYSGLETEVHSRGITELYITGKVEQVSRQSIEQLAGVKRVVSVSEKYRILGRRGDEDDDAGFSYNGVKFDPFCFHVFAGLCAVDTREHVEATMKALARVGLVTTRMGAYKPRTSPYDFQGLERECLPYVFELAGKYGIRIIAMEVLHESHVDDIRRALELAGQPTGVMLQVGTRNAQNFELLKQVGQQAEFPVLYKRGMGVTIDESLSACEYIASSGNPNIVFCLRGVKTHLGDPHRNLVDFTHTPVIKRLTRMPVCIDPSHSVGKRDRAADGLLEIQHATAQGIIAGANMVLVDVHPHPEKALCDGPQALLLDELEPFLDDAQLVHETYLRRIDRFATSRAKRP